MAAAPQVEESSFDDETASTFQDDVFSSSEGVTIYCRTRKTLKKGTGGVLAVGAGVGGAALIVGTGGLAAPFAAGGFMAAGAAAGGVATFAAGTKLTGYMVNPRVMRLDFDNNAEGEDAFEKIKTYKIMIRDNAIVQQKGKRRWIAELIGSAVMDSSEQGPGLRLDTPTQQFNILRSPATMGGSSFRVKAWKKFNIKQYATDSEELADQKWKKLSKGSNAVFLSGSSVEKKYGRSSYVNELVGWYVLGRQFGGDDKNKVKFENLDQA